MFDITQSASVGCRTHTNFRRYGIRLTYKAKNGTEVVVKGHFGSELGAILNHWLENFDLKWPKCKRKLDGCSISIRLKRLNLLRSVFVVYHCLYRLIGHLKLILNLVLISFLSKMTNFRSRGNES